MELPSGFRKIDTYTFYDEYVDNKMATVQDDGSINIPEENKNILKGEQNSEYITFDLPRYFDGIDLTTKLIRVHWFNNDNEVDGGGYAGTINGICSPDRIRFGWKVDNDVSAKEGPVTFQIEAIGTNEKKETYVKKTKYGTIIVLPSMDTGDGIEQPSETWYNQFVSNMQNMVNQAAAYRDEAKTLALDAWTRRDDKTGKRYRMGIENGVPYFEEIPEEEPVTF